MEVNALAESAAIGTAGADADPFAIGRRNDELDTTSNKTASKGLVPNPLRPRVKEHSLGSKGRILLTKSQPHCNKPNEDKSIL